MVSRLYRRSLRSKDTMCALKASCLKCDGWRVTTSRTWRLGWRNGKIPKSKDISMTVAFSKVFWNFHCVELIELWLPSQAAWAVDTL